MKHPILGDRLYGDLGRQENYLRIMLHAAAIEFEMPNGNKMKIKKYPPRLTIFHLRGGKWLGKWWLTPFPNYFL
ncbi:MAG: hypothetical protein L6420_10030 [Elusimicrobia bacterium]|nr:hypothetical protein [Elusimicrobiota bacterium]